MPLPNFFIAGAAKSGTTSLYYYLDQHPEIYMCPEKEPSYFIFESGAPPIEFLGDLVVESFRDMIDSMIPIEFDEYISMFNNMRNETMVGEASPDYLGYPGVPGSIHKYVPDAKFILILRNPYDAAYSDFLMKKRDGVWLKQKSFLDVLEVEDPRNKNMHTFPNILRHRLYDEGLERFIQTFGKDRVQIFLFEDLKAPQRLLKDCFEFLGVSTAFEPDFSIKYNMASSIASSGRLNSIFQKLPQSTKDRMKSMSPGKLMEWYTNKRLGVSKTKKTPTTKCPEEAKMFLKSTYNPSILRLQDLLDRDLSGWLG